MYQFHSNLRYRVMSNMIKCLFLSCLVLVQFQCRERSAAFIASTPVIIRPQYSSVQLLPQKDTLRFPLSENTYNQIRSFNYFTDKGHSYLSFYERRSQTILIYDFATSKRVKKIVLKKCFGDKQLVKVSSYVKSFDSIFVTNQMTFYLMDSSGTIKKSIDFFNSESAMATIQSSTPLIFRDGKIYTGVQPFINEKSLPEIRKWKTLYAFDFNDESRQLFYPVPRIYRDNIYGDRFFDYSYCYNDKGNFVFSFPADSSLYETDLLNYHRAYYGKSIFQKEPITPVSLAVMRDDNDEFKQFLFRDSYSTIYFDPYRKRYLRLVRHRILEADYDPRNTSKKQSVIVFDQNFRIIGECRLNGDFVFSTLFFTPDGSIYARINRDDEYALNFVRLEYQEELQKQSFVKN
jgi:hypothetical protein